MPESDPVQRALLEHKAVDQVIDRHRDGLDNNDRNAQAKSRADALGDGKESAHAEEERERKVLDERGTDEQFHVVRHHETSVRCTSWIRNSGFSTCLGFQVRTAQMITPITKNALGGRQHHAVGFVPAAVRLCLAVW